MHKPTPSPAVKSYAANSNGRDFIVGDIHGHFKLLSSLLKQVKFNAAQDRIFSVGDLVDRGPDSEQVTAWLKEPWFHAVRGNHEQMIVECMSGCGDMARHTRNGGAWLYDLPSIVQLDISRALHALPIMIELDLSNGQKIGIVHAEAPLLLKTDGWEEAKVSIACELGEEAQQQALKLALYSRAKIDHQDHSLIKGLDKLYVGHSTVSNVMSLGNVVYIDTGCSFADGALSLIELNSGIVSTVIMSE
ncbi:metallophosphoesterase [Pseudomonas fluorescens]|uniref:metallophosphoesterase n=1 Tax=Pseudomonas fluorescens TaxID=294 RepID=UPI0007D09264|nr:metallophosphoesterase [Pseudomonas fluorescens]